MSERPHLVFKKSEHARWRVPAHSGSVNCICVRVTPSADGRQNNPIIYTGGSDGVIKIWDGKDGRTLSRVKAFNSPITCLVYGDEQIIAGSHQGEILRLNAQGRPSVKWSAHRGSVTDLQIVNEGRVFSCSTDCTVKLFSKDTEVIRQFPAHPDDCKEGILQIQVIPSNILFTASTQGTIRVYNMRQELIKVLKTTSLQGSPLSHMQIKTSNTKISIFCGSNDRLVLWYLTLVTDDYGDHRIQIDAVKAITGRVERSHISAMKAIFVNPLYTKQPTVYLASNSGYIHLYVPTTKIQPASSQGQRVEAQKFKSYKFKDAHSKIMCVNCVSGRVYAGTANGNLLMWKEPLNMLKLRAVCKRQNDSHTFKPPARTSTSNSQQRTPQPQYSLPEVDEEPADPSPLIQFDFPVTNSKDIDSTFSSLGLDDREEPLMNIITIPLDNPPYQSSEQSSTFSDQSTSDSLFGLDMSNRFSSNAQQNQNQNQNQHQNQNAFFDLLAPTTPSVAQDLAGLDSFPDWNVDFQSSAPQQSSFDLDFDFNQQLPSNSNQQYPAYQFQPLNSFISQPEPSNSSFNSNQQYSAYQSQPISQTQATIPTEKSPSLAQQFLQSNLAQLDLKSNLTNPVSLSEPSILQEETRCVICLDKERNSALYGCGHACVCYECGKQLVTRKQKCPLCRAEIRDCIKLFR